MFLIFKDKTKVLFMCYLHYVLLIFTIFLHQPNLPRVRMSVLVKGWW